MSLSQPTRIKCYTFTGTALPLRWRQEREKARPWWRRWLGWWR